ncbi:MAG: ABC transporter permease [Puniceicoccales bacterium]|jgi:oligopeptide transport system permease protein|nr:ABC transporter permease [Puniceicoccales bacterium]
MFFFFTKRILFAIPIFLAVTFLTFSLVHSVPGGPFDGEKEIPIAIRQKLDQCYGRDRPFMEQYCRYIGRVFRGDFGPSYKYPHWDVVELVKSKALVSLEIGVYAMFFALMMGIFMGMLCVCYRGTWIDLFLSFLSTLGICLPAFIVGPLLIYVFGIHLRWVNVACWDHWGDKILPTLTIGILYASYVFRLTKRGLCDVLQKPYIIAARARGISERRIFFIHALKNGLLPVVAYMGPAFAGVISGAIVTETIFQIPGLGRLLIQAITNRDDMLILGIVNFYALAVVICNALADCVQAWLDPRIRLQ